MKKEPSIERLIIWRMAQVDTEAPPAPRAARLLELVRPWWERHPHRFSELVSCLEGAHARFGHAMEPDARRGASYPVPAVIARRNVELSVLADILYFHLRAGILRLRFELQPRSETPDPSLDVTFVATDDPRPLFSAPAILAPGGEYRVEMEVPEEVGRAWADLRVTDPMPFRFILRPADQI